MLSGSLSRFTRLAGKELKETLRDRRTLITLILMPLILYPVLSLAMSRLLLSGAKGSGPVIYRIGVASEHEQQLLASAIQMARQSGQIQGIEPLKIHWSDDSSTPLKLPSNTESAQADINQPSGKAKPEAVLFEIVIDVNGDLNVDLKKGDIDLAVNVQDKRAESNIDFVPLTMNIAFRENDSSSESAVIELRKLFASLNQVADVRNRMVLRIPDAIPVRMDARPMANAKSDRFGLAGIIPLIIILMTITGGVYPAIDLTAGERERGTLEALIASPISRFQLVASKYVAVLTVSILTAVINLFAMTITLKATGVGEVLMGPTSMQIMLMLRALPLVILFAVFFSGVLIGLCSFARSFKEAQAYLIPVVLLSLGPGVLSMMPSVKLTPTIAAAPQVNLILLSRDVIHRSEVSLMVVMIVVLTTVFYTVAALLLASKGFGDQVAAAGDDFRWSDLLKRPESPHATPTLAQLLGYLSLFFPFYFVIAGILNSLGKQTILNRTILNAVVVFVLFVLVPFAVSRWLKLNILSTFRIKIGPMPITSILVAMMLAPSLWICAFEIVQLAELIGIKSFDAGQAEELKKASEEFLQIAWWIVVLTVAVIPAIAEEFFFRGFALSALSSRLTTVQAIVWSSVLFGGFHIFTGNVLTPERFLPTAFLGLFLGILAVYSKSLLPGVLLHAGHNCLVASIPFFKDFFESLGLDQESKHLPWQWIAGSIVAISVALSLLFLRVRLMAAKNEPVVVSS
jgi:ABC-2 type transport system permease protein/sodium transport system permease protein